jgi:hypothetical protein
MIGVFRRVKQMITDRTHQRLIVKYTEGDCGILALALHEKIGYHIIATRYHENPRDDIHSYDHYGVMRAGVFWDIRGRVSEQDFVYLCDYRKPDVHNRCYDVIEPDLVIKAYMRISDDQKSLAIQHFLNIHGSLPA